MSRTIRIATMLLVAANGVAGAARADVTVSITINGDLDEIIPILELLRDMGIGADVLGEPGDPLRLNMHSVSTIDQAPAEGFEAVPPAPVDLADAAAPAPALTELSFTPTPAAPGTDVLVSVKVAAMDKQIDTLVAKIATVAEESFDLYDNGTHGDLTANDDVWSATVSVSPDVVPGEYAANITAYDPHGNPVPQGNAADTPLTIQGNLVVQR